MRVWQYILTHRGQNSITDLFGINEKVPDTLLRDHYLIQSQLGVCHADDLYYLFDPIFGLPPDMLTGEVINDDTFSPATLATKSTIDRE